MHARLFNTTRSPGLIAARQSRNAHHHHLAPFPGHTSSRRTLPIVGFRDRDSAASETLSLPLDYYRCLGVNRAAGREAVRKAYDRVLVSAADVGYSQDTLFSRAVLLRNAAQCLQEFEARKNYDAGGYIVDVSPQNLPAALVLLQESGESQLVINLGSHWLKHNSQDALASDVAAAVALAHCDEAAAALEQDSSVVLDACQHLETSLQMLRQYQMAPQLQQQIMQTLEDYSPRYCMELLAQPLDQPQLRQRGFTLLRRLAFELPQHVSPVGQDRDAFLGSARSLMTPQEHMHFCKALPAGTRLSAHQKLDIALAAVAVSYQQRQPQMVMRAASMYRQLHEAAAKEGLQLDVSVERAACALLLGDAQQALQLLGLSGAGHLAQQSNTDNSIMAFVLEHSPDSCDLLPGVYALSQTWLQEAVMGSFRLEAGQPAADLGPWFDSKRVQLYVQAYAALRGVRILAMLQAIPAGVAAFCGLALSSMLQLIGKGINRAQHKPYDCSSTSSEPVARSAAVAAAAAVAGPAAAAAAAPEGAAGGTGWQQLHEEELDVAGRMKLRLLRGGGSEEAEGDDVHADELMLHTSQGANLQERMQLQALEMQMWDSAEPEEPGYWPKVRRTLPAVLLAVAAAAALVMARSRDSGATASLPAAVWSVAQQ